MGKSKADKEALKKAKALEKERLKLLSKKKKEISFKDLPEFIKINVAEASSEDRKKFMSNFNK